LPVADKYWNARGGSSTDGVLSFSRWRQTLKPHKLTCTDKFGRAVTVNGGSVRCDTATPEIRSEEIPPAVEEIVYKWLQRGDVEEIFTYAAEQIACSSGSAVQSFCRLLIQRADTANSKATAIEVLTALHDRRYPVGDKRRATVIQLIEQMLEELFDSAPLFGEAATRFWRRIDWTTRDRITSPLAGEELLVIDALGFPPEGEDCDASLLRKAYQAGWKRFVVYRLRGQRFHGSGLGLGTDNVRIDSTVPAATTRQAAWMGWKSGSMETPGSGSPDCQKGKARRLWRRRQTFMYGAKGGEVFVRGNAAGRPLINAVGHPRVVINERVLIFWPNPSWRATRLRGAVS